MPLVLAEGQPVEGGKRAREEAPQRQLALAQLVCALRIYGDGDRGVEESLSATMHLVSEAGHVLEGYLRLRRGCSPADAGDREAADSIFTFCHSRVLAAWAVAMDET